MSIEPIGRVEESRRLGEIAQTPSSAPSAPSTPAAFGRDRITNSGEANEAHATSAPNLAWTSQPPAQPSVDLARRYDGMLPKQVVGKLPGFQAAGGLTNNCADFVSSVLKNSKVFNGHQIAVKDLKKDLARQGWKPVPAEQAKPGDVRFTRKGSHVEIVTEKGGTRTIGSNNYATGRQRVSERDADPRKGLYYSQPQQLAQPTPPPEPQRAIRTDDVPRSPYV